MSRSKFVIAGGGMVAGYAAKEMVERGLKDGELTIVSADTALPYERPPLSKGFLAGRDSEDAIRINAPEFYRDHGIEVRLQTRVVGADVKERRLLLENGEIPYESLVLALGSRVRKLEIPGSDLANVQYLRSMDDSKALRQCSQGVRQAVVIGSGFIGMEVASVLAHQGIETTMVLRDDRIWKNFFTPPMSAFFESYYEARGVRFVRRASVQGLHGSGSVSSALLSNGETINCQLVVAGIGVTPAIEPLQQTGLTTPNGIEVNGHLETAAQGVFAAGDIANYYDVLFDKRRRVEHWDNAVAMGQHCAGTLTGDRAPFRHVPYFFSDVFDLSYEFWGDTDAADEIVTRGDLTTNSFSVWWLRGGALIGAFLMNRPDEERTIAAALDGHHGMESAGVP